MKRSKGVNWKKRLLSAGMAVLMVATLLTTADWSSIVNAAPADKEETILYAEGATKMRVRGVINKINELVPDSILAAGYNSYLNATYRTWLDNNWYGKEKGTVERPFLILNIAPYYEQASFGYLVEGCEPFAFEKMSGDLYLLEQAANTLSSSDTDFMSVKEITEKTKFFLDEEQAQRTYYRASGISTYRVDNDADWESTYVKTDEVAIDGYYEVVPEGEGFFYIATDPDSGKKSIEVADNSSTDKKGTLVWHTINNYVKDEWAAVGYSLTKLMTFEEIQSDASRDINAFINTLKLTEVGARYRTTRTSGASDPYVEIPAGWLKIYQSNDVFVRDTIGLNKKEAQTYSVLVKNITPAELNANPMWAELADLVYVERENKCGALVKTFYESGAQQYRRADLPYSNNKNGLDGNKSKYSGTYDVQDYNGIDGITAHGGKSRDITGDVALRLIDRAARSTDYLAIVWDNTWDDGITRKSVDHYVYDLKNNRIKGSDNNDLKFSSQASYEENLGKLYVMCTTLRSNLLKRFFIDSNKIVVKSNNLVLADGIGRTADEQKYWNGMTFYIGADMYGNVNPSGIDTLEADGTNSTDGTSRYWDDYCGYIDFKADSIYVQGHCYTYNGNQAIFMGFESSGDAGVGVNVARFADYDEYARTNAKTLKIWKDLHGTAFTGNGKTSSPWMALRYILDLDKDGVDTVDEVTVLDVEPSVGLGSDSKPIWQLTEDMVALMIPSIAAGKNNIHITHYIMGAFVGTFEDLNTTYDMIYLGDDGSGFWTGYDVATYANTDNKWKTDSAKAGKDRTDFVDDSMDGLVYFHIGDKFKLKEYATSANFLYDYTRVANKDYTVVAGGDEHTNTVNTDNYTRQPGNDLTNVKKKLMDAYVTAGYAVVAAENLYDKSEHPYVDQSSDCILKKFLDENKATLQSDGTYSKGVLKHTQVSEIDEKVRFRHSLKMEITGTPVEYDFDNSNLSTRKYVRKEGAFGALDFTFKVPAASGYSYKIYLDQDRNSKFTSGEVAQSGPITSLTQSVTTYVTDGWVGFIQWRVEVYVTSNPNARVAKEGCSAIQAPSTNKNKIIALQIKPNDGTLNADLHNYKGTKDTSETDPTKVHGVPENNSQWSYLYNRVTDFDIEVYAITMSEFESLFRKGANGDGASYGFTYDMSKPIDVSAESLNTNPNREILEHIEKQDEHEALRNKLLGGHKLSDFNMIILGFSDSYGGTDISNKYGCAEYLFYFADRGKSILFTHDLTSFRNNHGNVAGYTATTMLRDIMGMNKYGIVSSHLINITNSNYNYNSDSTCRLAKSIAGYCANKMIPYETTSKSERHAYTYVDLAIRVGNTNKSYDSDRRMQYKYGVLDPGNKKSDGTLKEVHTDYLKTGGTNNGTGGNVAATNVAERLNKGQITEYPFQIDEVMKIADTHAQWYALNMEDPELTVWYTLADAVTAGNGTVGTTKDRNTYMGLLYGCIPQEAANNYYIYSKGNIFYSGVGHSSVGGEMERMLFVNTLIAAYRPSAQEPDILITNTEAVKSGNQYTIRVDQEFDYDGGTVTVQNISGSTSIPVYFIPRDYSLSPTLKCRIYYEEGETLFGGDSMPIYEVNIDAYGQKTQGARMTTTVPGLDHVYVLQSNHEYMIYHKKDLGAGDTWNHIIFEAKNDKSDDVGKAELFFKPRPLFILD